MRGSHAKLRVSICAYLCTCIVLNEQGDVVEGAKDPELGQDICTQMYTNMLRLNAMDNIFYDAQRQGRISFYMTSYGEEAIQFGSASAIRQGMHARLLLH